jgi:hypothetical protein
VTTITILRFYSTRGQQDASIVAARDANEAVGPHKRWQKPHKARGVKFGRPIQRLAEGATSLRREPNLWCVAGNHIEAAAHPFRGRKSRRRVKRGPNSRVDLRSDYSAAQTEQRI